MRIKKEHSERKAEIMDIAEDLFFMKGYDNCTISDILKSIGIAKGTFYHYFKSKEEVLDSIILRHIEWIVSRANEAANHSHYQPQEKLMYAFLAMNMTRQMDTTKLVNMHLSANSLFHQKLLYQIVMAMAPILVQIIEEGIKQNVWKCRYPLEYMQIFLAAAISLTDDGVFELEQSNQNQIMPALIAVLESILEVEKDMFLKMMNQQ